jgi:hypothetical protein
MAKQNDHARKEVLACELMSSGEVPEKVVAAAAALRAGSLKKLKNVKLASAHVDIAVDDRGTRLLHIAAEKVLYGLHLKLD